MHTFRRSLPAAVLGLGLLLSGCGGNPESRREISAVTVGGGAGFTPATVTVDKDDNVIMAVGNATSSIHGFSIEAYGLQTEVPVGGKEVKFQATHPGTFKIYCQLHPAHQVATLIVR